ncbi:hypothetical protein JTB14_007759 [Gonioctena quinquepunctata]|nr:hypothetical protein JTB14_007759 [Gonioctena quinquepunctata]
MGLRETKENVTGNPNVSVSRSPVNINLAKKASFLGSNNPEAAKESQSGNENDVNAWKNTEKGTGTATFSLEQHYVKCWELILIFIMSGCVTLMSVAELDHWVNV